MHESLKPYVHNHGHIVSCYLTLRRRLRPAYLIDDQILARSILRKGQRGWNNLHGLDA
jgi:hypothetical protein